MEALLEAECPRCNTVNEVDVALAGEPALKAGHPNLRDGDAEHTCADCGLRFRVAFSASIEVELTDFKVLQAPAAEFTCPACDFEGRFDEVEGESGDEYVRCENCEAQLEIRWSDWGSYVEAYPDE